MIDWSVVLLGVICCVGKSTAAAAVEAVTVVTVSVIVSAVATRVVVIVVMLRRKKLQDIQRNLLSYLNNRSAVRLLELGHNSERLTYVTCIIIYYYSHQQ
jgi:hypothetical protein